MPLYYILYFENVYTNICLRLNFLQVFWTFMDGSLPYLKYSYRKFRARYTLYFIHAPSVRNLEKYQNYFLFFQEEEEK